MTTRTRQTFYQMRPCFPIEIKTRQKSSSDLQGGNFPNPTRAKGEQEKEQRNGESEYISINLLIIHYHYHKYYELS